MFNSDSGMMDASPVSSNLQLGFRLPLACNTSQLDFVRCITQLVRAFLTNAVGVLAAAEFDRGIIGEKTRRGQERQLS